MIDEIITSFIDDNLKKAEDKNIQINLKTDPDIPELLQFAECNYIECLQMFLDLFIDVLEDSQLTMEMSGYPTDDAFTIYTGIRIGSRRQLNSIDINYARLSRILKERGTDLKVTAERAYFLIEVPLPKMKDDAHEILSVTDNELSDDMVEEPEPSKLPDVVEFDWNYSKTILGDDDLIVETLELFYGSIDSEIALYEDTLAHLDDAEQLKTFRIRVHALKSTCKMLGAFMLSGMARKGEVAAIDSDIEVIKQMIPLLIGELKHHKSLIIEAFPQFDKSLEASPKVDYDNESFQSIIEEIDEAAESVDFDLLDSLSTDLDDMSIPDNLIGKVSILQNQIIGLSIPGIKNAIEEIKSLF